MSRAFLIDKDQRVDFVSCRGKAVSVLPMGRCELIKFIHFERGDQAR